MSHNASATDKQAAALEKLLADPDKPVHIPQGSRERGIRPPKDMIRNVQGSSAGAGSGEFHVYKESRRREYERLKLMDEADAKVRLDLSRAALCASTDGPAEWAHRNAQSWRRSSDR